LRRLPPSRYLHRARPEPVTPPAAPISTTQVDVTGRPYSAPSPSNRSGLSKMRACCSGRMTLGGQQRLVDCGRAHGRSGNRMSPFEAVAHAPNSETSHRPLSELETLHSRSALPWPADRDAIVRFITRGFSTEIAVWRPRSLLAGAELALRLVGLARQSVGSTVVARSTSGALWPLGGSCNVMIHLRKVVPLA
jgi:hypothetical protein